MTDTDPRFAFLCVAHSHYQQVDAGHEPLDIGFSATVRVFDRFRPPPDPECKTCGSSPCHSPSFCTACERADDWPKLPKVIQSHRPTPQTVIEAIMFCVRERGLNALKEPKVSAWLNDCDAVAKQQLKSRIRKLQGSDTNELRRTA